ncbi:hypothetical protein N7509_004553 [Penicillium cosmopolitanum]|uniref:UEV domain-containing protein n=1 Tax=Penicillium cosmopolitanum TaxID=1131564 RepID=A0A9W9W0J6_9EURO|nr:uncharacterized protein N7509_004553 [Penicillium cosmopolitanum]KAJ5396440.1 hypothetical protein N7509_004553 [Penicillium cosmopolitanum]
MAVPQRTLSWLYSVLTKVGLPDTSNLIITYAQNPRSPSQDHYDPKQTYQDPNRTYHDIANALAQYPSLSPRTDVYTYENGFSALLLHLVGTLPVVFRGSTYRFPVTLWIPNTYPREPPMVYVTPTQEMTVRVGQHVTLEGRVYHHYLAHWAEAWDRSTTADLLLILREVFAKEPPVRYRQQMAPQPQSQETQAPPPLPPLPPGIGPSPTANHQPTPAPVVNTPPQLPPKPGAGNEAQQRPAQLSERYQSPPPLPPLPPKPHEPGRVSQAGQGHMASPGSRAHHFAGQPSISQTMAQPPAQSPHGIATYNGNGSGPVSPGGQFPPQQQFAHHPPPTHAQVPQVQYSGYEPHPPQQHPPPPTGPPYPQHSPYPQGYQHPPPSTAAPKPKQQTPDLLTSPFELELPSFAPAGPAPPIPPNPEKDALLHAVSRTLTETLHAHATQSDTAAQSLVSQSHSLHAAMATLQGEVSNLNSLHASLQSNTAILQQSIHRADATIADAQVRSASASASASAVVPSTSSVADPQSCLPPIDEVLVAPTVVGKQLYDLVAEEQGLQHALYALQAALVRGVIGVDSWSRHTRGLAREAFLKRALIRKIGLGMGLEEA